MNCRFSNAADQDLDDIYDFSVEQFGLYQADSYVESLIARCEQIGQFPKMGVLRPEISKNIRLVVHASHLIFYTIMKEYVWIVRILHHSQDAPSHLKG